MEDSAYFSSTEMGHSTNFCPLSFPHFRKREEEAEAQRREEEARAARRKAAEDLKRQREVCRQLEESEAFSEEYREAMRKTKAKLREEEEVNCGTALVPFKAYSATTLFSLKKKLKIRRHPKINSYEHRLKNYVFRQKRVPDSLLQQKQMKLIFFYFVLFQINLLKRQCLRSDARYLLTKQIVN